MTEEVIEIVTFNKLNATQKLPQPVTLYSYSFANVTTSQPFHIINWLADIYLCRTLTLNGFLSILSIIYNWFLISFLTVFISRCFNKKRVCIAFRFYSDEVKYVLTQFWQKNAFKVTNFLVNICLEWTGLVYCM